MCYIEFIKLDLKLKSIFRSDDALQRYWRLKIDFSKKFDSTFLLRIKSLKLSEINLYLQ